MASESSITTEELEQPVVDGPGKQLKAIREAQGLELSMVATSLHLSVPLLQALERDDYSAMAGPVFVQGYLRNYARLLSVDVESILDAYHRIRPEDDALPDLRATQVRQEVRSSHGIVRAITWLIVIGLIALLVTWWRGYLHWPLQLDPMTESSTQAPMPEGEVAAVAENDPPLTEFKPSPEMLGAASDNPAAMAGSEEEVAAEPLTLDQQPETAQAEGPGSEPAMLPQQSEISAESESVAIADQAAEEMEASVTEATIANEAAATTQPVEAEASKLAGRVIVSFSGPCWVEISGANGSYRKLGNQKAGDVLVLQGEAPYVILLGNAEDASMVVDGEPYDLTPHTRGNVARLTLELN